MYQNDIFKPKPFVRLIPGRVEKIDPSKQGDKKKVVWTQELVDKCEETDFFKAEQIKLILEKIVENPERNIGIGPDSQNNDLDDFIKKIRANQFLTKLPAVDDPLANDEKDSCDTKKRWTAEYFE